MKYIPFIAAACMIMTLTSWSSEKFSAAVKNHEKRVAIIIASQGFQPMEYSETKRVLSHAGFSVTTVSTKPGWARATDNSKAQVEKTLRNFIYQKYDGIFIIGGPGAQTELDKEPLYTIIKQAYKAGKVVGAICYSPRILAKAGILQNKKATGWNDDQEIDSLFKRHGVIYTPEPVVTDGTIITADGPMAATAFGKAIVKIIEQR